MQIIFPAVKVSSKRKFALSVFCDVYLIKLILNLVKLALSTSCGLYYQDIVKQ